MTVSRKQLLVRLSTVAGVVVAVAGMVFVGRKLAVGWTEYREVIADARWGWLLVALPLAMVGMSSVGMVWRRIIIALGGQVSRPEIFVWYQLGQMAKYLPGGVWPMVGRSEMAVRGRLRRSLAYNSVALSMGVRLPLRHAGQRGAAARGDPLRRRPGRRALGVRPHPDRAAGRCTPRCSARCSGLAEKVLGGAEEQQVPPWTESVKLVLRHVPSWLCIGVSTWFVALTFDPNAPLLHVVFAGVLSWVTGFIVVFVPGGLGVREAAFTAAAGGALDPEIAATVAVVSRLVFMYG